MSISEPMSVGVAAGLLGYTRRTVLRKIEAGELTAQKLDATGEKSAWILDAAEVRCLAERLRQERIAELEALTAEASS